MVVGDLFWQAYGAGRLRRAGQLHHYPLAGGRRGVHVAALTADLGQPDEANIADIPERMRAAGAEDAVLVDARDKLAQAGLEIIQTQARYEGGYWNTTGIARHVTVQALLPEVQRRGITVLGHGATGRGNDQVRFQLVANMLAPEVQVYAPWRDTEFLEQFPGRREMIVYCEQEEIPIRATLDKPYSTDANLLGLTHEAGQLEELETPAQFVRPQMGAYPHEAPDAAQRVAIRFEQGVPTAIDGRSVTPREAIEQANAIGGRHGVGIGLHVVENRFVGIKSRGVYEAPGMGAARDLLCLPAATHPRSTRPSRIRPDVGAARAAGL